MLTGATGRKRVSLGGSGCHQLCDNSVLIPKLAVQPVRSNNSLFVRLFNPNWDFATTPQWGSTFLPQQSPQWGLGRIIKEITPKKGGGQRSLGQHPLGVLPGRGIFAGLCSACGRTARIVIFGASPRLAELSFPDRGPPRTGVRNPGGSVRWGRADYSKLFLPRSFIRCARNGR